VLVEMTMVAPVLLLLALGALEMGIAWRDAISVTHSSRQGARTGSHLGDELMSDRETLAAVDAVLGGERGNITRVVIFDADIAGEMAAGCMTASQAGRCNHYTGAQVADVADASKWGCAPGAHDRTWCSDTRTNPNAYLGVYVEFDRPWVSGLFGGTGSTLDGTTVMRIEPEYSA